MWFQTIMTYVWSFTFGPFRAGRTGLRGADPTTFCFLISPSTPAGSDGALTDLTVWMLVIRAESDVVRPAGVTILPMFRSTDDGNFEPPSNVKYLTPVMVLSFATRLSRC